MAQRVATGQAGRRPAGACFGKLPPGRGLRELKSFQIRMPFAYAKDQRRLIVVTHGFIKKTDRAPRKEILRARKILEEDQVRHGLKIVKRVKQ